MNIKRDMANFKDWFRDFNKVLKSNHIKDNFQPNTTNPNEYIRQINILKDICKNKLDTSNIILKFYNILNIKNSFSDLDSYKNYFEDKSKIISDLKKERNEEMKIINANEIEYEKYNSLLLDYKLIRPEEKKNLSEKNKQNFKSTLRYNPGYNTRYNPGYNPGYNPSLYRGL